MPKRAVIRKTVKWGGLAACVLLAAAWVGSYWFEAWWVTPGSGIIGVDSGLVASREPLWPPGFGGRGEFVFEAADSPMRWWFRWGHWSGGWTVAVPLWAPLLIAACATAAAWHADLRERRRQRVGCCPACGYNRQGLDAGKACPECGKA